MEGRKQHVKFLDGNDEEEAAIRPPKNMMNNSSDWTSSILNVEAEDFLPAASKVPHGGSEDPAPPVAQHMGSLRSRNSSAKSSTSRRSHRGRASRRASSKPTSLFRSLLTKNSILSRGSTTDQYGHEKLRLLALHGKASNGEVTKLQLANLGVTDDKYDIVYLNGPIVEEDGDPEVTEFVGGAFYSWFYGNYSDARYKPSFFRAISHVFTAIQKLGPFDAVYGFSQGATVAAFTALAFTDIELGKALISFNNASPTASPTSSRHGRSIIGRSIIGRSIIGRSIAERKSATNLQFGQSTTGRSGPAHMFKKSMISKTEISRAFFDEVVQPFDYMILACPVEDPVAVKDALGLSGSGNKSTITIPSMHLIGVSDPRKAYSEKMESIFSDVYVKYMVGGHSVPRHVASDKDLLHTLQKCLGERQNAVELEPPFMKSMSDLTSMGLMSSVQVAHVELNGRKMENTLVKALTQKDRNQALLFNAREADESNYTSYGDVLDFIQGGAGDLRRLGIQHGEVVSYGAPPGGGAVPALAFLSIMAQTTAAPLAPSSQESDAIYFLEQFNAKHLILFEGVECPGLEAAFEKYAATGKATLHRATIRNGGKPGMFDYTQTSEKRLDKNWVPSNNGGLQNPADGIGLLLGTSGTTSKPKGVPVLQSSLVQNGYIIASSLGLRESDTCYSIMPLFHIGGISASVLCSIAAGGSICCDNQAYNPESMIDALALSNPKPTWYSSVPTIHNATVSYIRDMTGSSEKLKSYGVNEDNGIWKDGHSLRMIRSGAAALLGPDAINLSTTFGGIPVIPTYSMSEQMPISQPPAGKTDMITDKPGSVGVPVATSLAIVDSTTLKPLPFGREGEIAISGPTVISNYLNNQDADRKAFFQLTLPLQSSCAAARGRFFLTGDVGVLDKEGFLSLKGRNKELIKKGGEQISPFEIEEPLLDHPWIDIAICFAVPSQIYGEEAGVAIVLSPNAPTDVTTNALIKEMRMFLQKKDVSPLKWPTKWKIVQDDDLPKTKTKKYIRIGLSKHLNLEDEEVEACQLVQKKHTNNTFIDWDVISGFRFLLACYVMFMHIGSNSSWGALKNLRSWPWHVHVFFTLGGFSLAAPMNPVIEKKFKYFLARIGAMYPMYAVALIFVFINLLVTCRPSTFRPDFHWDAQPDDLYIDGDESKGFAPLFCEGTPTTPTSYWASLFLTILVYVTGSAITPVFLTSWWMGYYFWFSAMYYQCLMIFPVLYNRLAKWRSNVRKYLITLVSLLVLNLVLLLVTWFVTKDYEGYNHYDEATGLKNDPNSYQDAHKHNVTILAWYLFSPFWMLYFVIGAVTAFLYDAYRPAEKYNNRMWGHIADGCTLFVVIWSISLVCQGNIQYGIESNYFLRPQEADNYTDTAQTNRLWTNICGRLLAPLTTIWVFSLSTGQGWTASILRSRFLIDIIAPHAYNCFLFHQPVGQWYLAATRDGLWWNWWRYRKTMYWFSPAPLPVEWYEYFYIVVLVVGFSALMNATAMPFVSAVLNFIGEVVFGQSSDEEINMEDALIDAIEDMSGFAPELDWTLDQCGLSSVGLPQLAQRLQKALSSKSNPMPVNPATLSSARTVGDIVKVLYEIKAISDADGI